MTDPNRDHPSYMPSDEEITREFYATFRDRMDWQSSGRLHRLIERACLKAAVKVMSEWADHGDFHDGPPRRANEPCRACEELRRMQARLAELEAEHE